MSTRSPRGLRVSKYDPALRNAEGHFLGDEWTSLTDLPDSPEAMAAYRRTEDQYIRCVRDALTLTAPRSLTLVGVERRTTRLNVPSSVMAESRELHAAASELDGPVSASQVELFVRAALRELIWGKIEGSDGFHVHIGYDFYLYLGNHSGSVQRITNDALFLEPMDSPYL